MNYTIETLAELIQQTNLTDREKYVVCMRLAGATLKEIGERFGVDRERTRQIEGKAMRKLSHPSRFGVKR